MGLTGFDPSVVNSSLNAINSAYENLIGALGNDIQQQFIGGMADKWACNDAIRFFNEIFKPEIDRLIAGTNDTFQSVFASMNSAAQAWANNTESSYSPVSFSAISVTMNVGGIVENIGGVRGIDVDQANIVAGKLPTIAETAKSALTAAQQAVQNCGFIGGNQASNLIGKLGEIKQKIDGVTETITIASKEAIAATVTKYADTEGKVSRAFAGQ